MASRRYDHVRRVGWVIHTTYAPRGWWVCSHGRASPFISYQTPGWHSHSFLKGANPTVQKKGCVGAWFIAMEGHGGRYSIQVMPTVVNFSSAAAHAIPILSRWIDRGGTARGALQHSKPAVQGDVSLRPFGSCGPPTRISRGALPVLNALRLNASANPGTYAHTDMASPGID